MTLLIIYLYVSEAEAAPQFNSLLTDHALAGHPLNNPFLPPTANAIAAATAAAHHPHGVNHALHDPLHATHALHHPFHAGNGLHHGLHPGVHHPLHHGHHGLPLLHPALSPALPIPSILPTLQAHVSKAEYSNCTTVLFIAGATAKRGGGTFPLQGGEQLKM